MTKTDYTIRPLTGDDVETLATWFQDFDDVALFDRSAPIPLPNEVVAKAWKADIDASEPRKSLWLAAVGEDDKLLGVGGVCDINYIHGDGIAPLFVSKEARSMGVGLAISQKVLDLAFNSLRLHRLSTFFREDNKATETILQKLGFQIEGRRREAWFHRGKHFDVIFAGILKQDWISARTSLKQND